MRFSLFRTRVPPPIYAAVAGVLIYGLHRFLPQATVVGGLGWMSGIAAISMGVLGVALVAWAARVFGHVHTTIDPRDPYRASQLVTVGPYAFTRNPMYLGLLLLLTGWAIWLGNLVGLLVPPLFVVVVTFLQILPEERALATLFGGPYGDYRHRVHRWFGRSRYGGATVCARDE